MTAYHGSGRINLTTNFVIVGLSQGHDRQVIRGDPSTRSFSVCYLKRGELVAVEATRGYMAARRLIGERRAPVLASYKTPTRLLEPSPDTSAIGTLDSPVGYTPWGGVRERAE